MKVTEPDTCRDPAAAFTQAGDYVEAYEAALARTGNADLRAFLPAPSDALYLPVLHELIRVELEQRWGSGRPRPLDEYRRDFPEAFADPGQRHDLAFEEYRLRLQAGERPARADYERRLGIATDHWPEFSASSAGSPENTVVTDPPAPPQDPVEAYSRFQAGADVHEADLPATALLDGFRALHQADPQAACRLAQAVSGLPEPGTEFLGFRLLAELGRGAFGRVYLAEQPALAHRRVALKVSADMRGESQRLAQLLHSNVVPVYSLHDAGPLQAVCMPYLGATTLADVLRGFAAQKSLPGSGRELVSTLQNQASADTRRGLGSGSASGGGAEVVLPAVPDAAPQVGSTVILEQLQKLSYVDAVLFLVARLADGLAHAHERGILHRDLKPANVLLTDEGQPMLLDFNLAEDTKLRASASAAQLGGTLPYMSPEQLVAFGGDRQPLDARSDLFSLGIIFYQLLGMRNPFPLHTGPVQQVVANMLEDRHRRPTSLRCWNRDVTPAVDAIVRRCLEADPARRYPSARALQEDLERQLDDLPLKHTREPSLRERTRKWVRRHPRVTSTTSVCLLALALLFGLASLLLFNHYRLQQLEAVETLNEFENDLKTTQLLLTEQSAEPAELDEAIARGRRALGRYGVLDNPNWRDGSAVQELPEERRQQLTEEVGVLAFLLARATALQSDRRPADRDAAVAQALELNALAAACFGQETANRAVLVQRSELEGRRGRKAEAERLLAEAGRTPVRTPLDRYLTAREHVVHGRYREALPLLRTVTADDPTNGHAWFLLGRCRDGLGQHGAAAACYTTGIALWPRSHRLFFNRGLARLRQNQFADAAADFEQVLRLKPGLAEAHFNRGIARHKLKQHAAAEADLTRALELGIGITRVYFLRARVRDQLGNKPGAARTAPRVSSELRRTSTAGTPAATPA